MKIIKIISIGLCSHMLPIVSPIIVYLFFPGLIEAMKSSTNKFPPAFFGILITMTLIQALFFLVFIIIIINVIKNTRVSSKIKIVWIFSFIVAGLIAIPFYYWKHYINSEMYNNTFYT